MNVQEVFDKVIAAGYYNAYRPVMCPSLELAKGNGLITDAEERLAKAEIKGYLGAWGSLGEMLLHFNLDSSFEARHAIYKNWVNRPVIKGVKK